MVLEDFLKLTTLTQLFLIFALIVIILILAVYPAVGVVLISLLAGCKALFR